MRSETSSAVLSGACDASVARDVARLTVVGNQRVQVRSRVATIGTERSVHLDVGTSGQTLSTLNVVGSDTGQATNVASNTPQACAVIVALYWTVCHATHVSYHLFLCRGTAVAICAGGSSARLTTCVARNAIVVSVVHGDSH